MELYHQGVPKRECPLPCRTSGAALSVAEGYGYSEECEAVGPLFVPEEGLGLGKLLNMP